MLVLRKLIRPPAENVVPKFLLDATLATYITMPDSSKTTGLELCVACQKKHPFDKCESIMEKPLNRKFKILREVKLCYGYLKPMAKDHNAKNC